MKYNKYIPDKVILSLVIIALCLFSIFVPEQAFAATKDGVSLATGIDMLKTITTNVFLPVAIVIVAFKIVYGAVCGYLLGIDPLNWMGSGGHVSASDASKFISENFGGFFKGLLWIGGVFIVFRLALALASLLAQELSTLM